MLRKRLLEWAREERQSWSACMKLDPLLPRTLSPNDYQGEVTWNKRIASLRHAAKVAASTCDNK
jgi:hypothetical protein